MTGPQTSRPRPIPRRGTNPLQTVVVLVVALAGYFVLIGARGWYLLGENRWTLKLLGSAVLVFPVIGAWLMVAELRFGLASQRLGERLRVMGIPIDLPDLPRNRSGRVDRAAADAWFDERRALVLLDPDNWGEWYRLAQAYDLAGDRRRARGALRTAISKAPDSKAQADKAPDSKAPDDKAQADKSS